MNNAIKAVGLLSGGLDSTLAAKLILEQGIQVYAINFTSPFCSCTAKSAGCASVITAVKQLGDIPLERVALGEEYLKMVKSPKYGHGAGINPCIDCRIMKIRLAGEYMRKIGASFLFTGEVLGQRPMSQHRKAINIIDKESGLQGLIVRPLSAVHFPATIPETEGWLDRARLLAITGRSRKPQIALASEKGINDYPCPAGGCKLTDKHFAEKLKDYFAHTDKPLLSDMALLKTGRHFRLDNGDKVIVARDEREGHSLEGLSKTDDYLIVPQFPAPTVILKGSDVKKAVKKMMEFTKHEIDENAVVWLYRKAEKIEHLLATFLKD